jgi:retron-type reverse transcriptase
MQDYGFASSKSVSIRRFEVFARKESQNYTKQCFILKCDIKKFFASIDHEVLFRILEKRIEDKGVLSLLRNVVQSFSSNDQSIASKYPNGLPLGNLTSQLLVNIYMNEFDQFVKHELKEKYYIRYADDFVFMNQDRAHLEEVRQKVEDFLTRELKLTLHPDKVFIKTIYSGVDFLGLVHFPKHRVIRAVTKKRMLRKVNEKNITSYRGLLKNGNAWKVLLKIRLE